MKKLNIFFFALLALLCGSSCSGRYYPDISTTVSPKGTDIFAPDSTSIAQSYVIPEWFSDSKLGIFIHYGVYTVPAYGSEWYARWMYTENSKIHQHHVATYGDPTEFGYKDFVPMFKAPNFDAAAWADLFVESGAKYIVPVAEHHDGFSMYKSAWNKWNSVDMGPHIDFIGELSKTVRERGLRFGLSSHRAENPWFFNEGLNFASDVRDGDCSMYGQCIERPEGKGMTPEYGRYEGSNEESRREWLLHIYELIDMYEPDLIWFDWTVGKYPFHSTFYKFLAYYYNNAVDWGRDVVVNTKCGFGDNIQVFDIERGKSDRIRHYAWQTDTSIGNKSWSYTPDEVNKTPNHVIDDFVDIVSKNGNLLLNIGPKLDGTITDEQSHVLRELGAWLKVNGEAIYDTRHWVRWGEGDAKTSAGYMTDSKATHYSENDVRFTVKGNSLYAVALDWNAGGEVVLESLAAACGSGIKISNVSLLGSEESIKWQQGSEGLSITMPESAPSDYAHAFKIDFHGVVYGDIQASIVEGDLVVEQYVHNNSDEPTFFEVACSCNDGKAQRKCVRIEPRAVGYVRFVIATSAEINDITLCIDDTFRTTKTVTLTEQERLQGKKTDVIHNTDAMYGTPQKVAKK